MILIDFGSWKTKVGFHANTNPIFELNTPIDVFLSKTVKNMDNLEIFCVDLFTKHLMVDPKDKHFMISESVFEEKQSRKQIYEIFFESFLAKQVALVPDAISSLYSYMKPQKFFSTKAMTGLVIESGHSQTAIVPIVEGHIIEKGIQNYPVNGKMITEHIMANLLENNPKITDEIPRSEIFQNSQKFKHLYNRINFDDVSPKVKQISLPVTYKKKKIEVMVDEVFKNSLNMYFTPQDFNPSIKKNICQHIAKSVNKCPFDVKKLVYQNVVLSGYASEINGFKKKFEIDMNQSANQKKLRESLKFKKTQAMQSIDNVNITLKVFENAFSSNSAWQGMNRLSNEEFFKNKFID